MSQKYIKVGLNISGKSSFSVYIFFLSHLKRITKLTAFTLTLRLRVFTIAGVSNRLNRKLVQLLKPLST